MKRSTLALALLILFASCNKDEVPTPPDGPETELNLPETPYDYTTIDLPAHLTTNVLLGPGQNAAADNDNTPASNLTTAALFPSRPAGRRRLHWVPFHRSVHQPGQRNHQQWPGRF